MEAIGGDVPALLSDFTPECYAGGLPLRDLTPVTISAMNSFRHHRPTVVDLACKELSASFYSGDHRDRQSIDVSFGDFLDYFESSFRGEDHWLGTVEGLQFYLCQCPIAVVKPDETCSEPTLPQIMELFRIPPSLSDKSVSQVNLWMAVNPSQTGIHYDAYRNVLFVLHGKKRLKLYPPSQTKNLYPRPIFSRSANHSSVNFKEPDLSKYASFASINPIIIEVLPGSAVYIPEGWWHQVDTDAFTVAVNFWFDGLRDRLVKNPDMSPYYARVVIEEMVRAETTVAIDELRRRNVVQLSPRTAREASQAIAGVVTQQERESVLLSMNDEDMKLVQLNLASEHPSAWKELLANATDEFATFIADFWDRLDNESTWVPTVFGALGDDIDLIKNDLLEKQERFKQTICKEVIAATFGV